MRRGDVATTQALIVAGASLKAKNMKCEDDDYELEYLEAENEVSEVENDANVMNVVEVGKGVTPLDLVTAESPCFAFVDHHSAILAILTEVPKHLVSSVLAHCATLSSCEEFVPAPVLFLSSSHFDSSFLWAPSEAREMVFKWARDAFIAQLAANIQPFADLPDDCAGDVLECLEMSITRRESLLIATHCSSPQAIAWVRAVVAVAVAMSTNKVHEQSIRLE